MDYFHACQSYIRFISYSFYDHFHAISLFSEIK